MAAPLLAQVYFIINKESGLACDLGPGIPGSERPVIGLPFNGHDSQKVLSIIINDPSTSSFCWSNLGLVSSQWRFTRYDQYWVIQNITDGRFMDIQTPPGVAPGAPVITKDEREWEVAHDEQFDGWR